MKTKKKYVNLAVFPETKDRFKVKAAKQKKLMSVLLDELSKST